MEQTPGRDLGEEPSWEGPQDPSLWAVEAASLGVGMNQGAVSAQALLAVGFLDFITTGQSLDEAQGGCDLGHMILFD